MGGTEIIRATRARLSEARPGDGLKAAEMLARTCRWNEAEQIKHDHVHLQVDSALIEQRRAGCTELARRQQKQIATIRLIVRIKPLDNMLLAGVVWRGTRC
jgi:hypothetical protein